MSSEHLASAQTELKGDLGASWNILDGASANYTDLGIARRFGGAAAAYSLRDIGAMNGRVVKARREPHDGSTTSVNDEEDFSASQVQSGVLEDWVNGKLESTLPAENSPQLAVQVVIEHSDINSGASTTLKFFPQTTYTTRTPTVDGITYSIRDIIYRTYPLNVAGSFQLYADGNARWKINAFNTSTSSYDDGICHLKTTDLDRRTFNYSGGTSGLTFTQAVTRTPIDFPTTSDWVTDSGTGTLTSIAITSVSPAAAAYSLRKVNSSYSGNAVRIRRSSDNIEVDVAFDSDGKVSASSPITDGGTELTPDPDADLGSTTATTLGDFISYRDNIIGNSEFNTAANLGFDDGSSACPLWDKAGSGAGSATFTSNTTETTDPNGGNTAAKFQWSASGTNWLRQETELAAGVEITFSAYYKQLGSQTTVRHNYWSGSSDKNVVLDFSNGTISEAPSGGTAPTSSAVQNVGNGWYRVSMVLTTVAGTTENKAQPARQPASVTGGGVYVWGAMLEVGNTLGTYVKTTSEIPNGVAFVHTWYDQAGVNNAVQETAANQPKIAENGALITKQGQPSLKFRGTDSTPIYLDSPANITANFSFFIAAQPAADGTTFGSVDNEKRNHTLWSEGGTFHMAGINSDFTNGFRHGNTILSYSAGVDFNTNLNLHSLTNGSSNVDYFGNAVNKINTTNSTSTATSYDIGRKVNITSHNTRGYISEFIHYNSDQSANRFKIESNINNYYGFYNDANDLSTNWTENSTDPFDSSTFSANGKEGFTGTHTSSGSNDYARADITLKNPIPQDDSIFISYNCTFNSGSPSPNIVGQQSDGTTNTFASNPSVSEGFNSHNIVPNNGATAIIQIVDNTTGSFTISDFKISRIARNGFVETLYDQSGNGRDISQASASNQPTIVSNGGIYKSGAYPSIRYTDTSATYLVTESYSPVQQGGSGMPNFTLFAVTGIPESAGFDSIVSAGGSEGSNSIGGFKLRHLKDASSNIDSRIDIAQTGVSPHQANAQSNNATPQSVNLLTSYLDSTDDELFAQQNSATSGTTTTTLIPLSGQGAENDNLKVGTDMFNDSPRASYLGEILEIILYTDSKKSDLSDLTDEINNFYNI